MKRLLSLIALTAFSFSAHAGFVVLKDLGRSSDYRSNIVNKMLICGYDGLSYVANINTQTGQTVGNIQRIYKYDNHCSQYRATRNTGGQQLPQDIESIMYQRFLQIHQ